MSDTVKLNHCPKCSAPIPAGAPQGLCPKCVLVGAAMATETGIPATATSEIPSLDRIAAAFPQLEILELIGRGGMGFVFKARQPRLDRFVALKLLPDKLARDPRFAERFNREGRVLAKLNHPNIVSVYDFGNTEHFYFLVMEYVDGVNLRQAMRAGRFSPTEALAIVPRICEALQYAHGQGILHRDIKPENILLDARGQVKIADFGIAKLVGEETPDLSLTATGAALGTPHYMAPEQFEKPAEVDHRADIYSLGVVFYEMLTGELPIGRFAAPSSKTPVGVNVDEVVFRTLEKDRERRYQSAGEMGTQVEHLSEAHAAAPPQLPGQRSSFESAATVAGSGVAAWSQKSLWAAALTVLSMPAAFVLLVLIYLRGGQPNWAGLTVIIGVVSLPGLFGTILGWLGLYDIRASGGRLRGAVFALFSALAWPLILVVGATLIFPWALLHRTTTASGSTPTIGMWVALGVPVGTITFAVWAVFATARWAGHRPPSRQRGVLKWVFLVLLLAGFALVSSFRQLARNSAPATLAETNSPWIRFTFTSVELREVAGVRWLVIDYVDDPHGECQKAFPWETTIPGFTAQTRTTEAVKEDKDSPKVHHRRIEYQMPYPMLREQLEKLRADVERDLHLKSFRLELGEQKLLFELPSPTGGSLKAWLKVMPPLVPTPDAQPASKNTPGAPIRRVEFRVPTIENYTHLSLSLTTDSKLPSGDYLVGLVQRPDGRVEELHASTTLYAGKQGVRPLTHIIWQMSQFESNRVLEIAATVKAAMDGRVIDLIPNKTIPVFRATNQHGGVTAGFIALRSQNVPASGIAPASVSILEVPQSWVFFLSVKLRISAPAGYMPHAVGLLGEDALETHTSMMGDGSQSSCFWYFPLEWSKSDLQEVVHQLADARSSSRIFRIAPGERVPVFAVTNQAGATFRGYFELSTIPGTK